MSARRQIIAALSEDSLGGIATLQDVAHAEQLVDAYRAEVLAKAIGRLRAIPVDCTALTGPVWYGDGWNSAITCLEAIADYRQPDDEEYPGELQRLRATVLALRVAALRKEDLAEAQRVLNDHEDWRKKAAAPAATATTAQAGASAPATGPAHEWPDDWEHVLDTAIRAWGGEWSPKRVQRLYLARYARGLYRSDARNFLSQLAHQGVLLLHDRPTGRHYTLNTTKGGTR